MESQSVFRWWKLLERNKFDDFLQSWVGGEKMGILKQRFVVVDDSDDS